MALFSSLGFKRADKDAMKKEPYDDLIFFEIDTETEEANKLWRSRKYVAWDIRY